MNSSDIEKISYLGMATHESKKIKDQVTMLRLLALGRKQIEEGKVIDHDKVLAFFKAEEPTTS